jgi:ABC-type iron transport system FetAB permease component
MLPTINQMSVIGLIAIPGMMTGQIMGGASVLQAARYQQIIMFMISASTALAVLTAVVVKFGHLH